LRACSGAAVDEAGGGERDERPRGSLGAFGRPCGLEVIAIVIPSGGLATLLSYPVLLVLQRARCQLCPPPLYLTQCTEQSILACLEDGLTQEASRVWALSRGQLGLRSPSSQDGENVVRVIPGVTRAGSRAFERRRQGPVPTSRASTQGG
jgi:hypothetical protein